MKKILKYFLDNFKITVSLISIILGCGFPIFLFFKFIDFVMAMVTSPVVAFMIYILLLIIIISVLLTLLDVLFNKSD